VFFAFHGASFNPSIGKAGNQASGAHVKVDELSTFTAFTVNHPSRLACQAAYMDRMRKKARVLTDWTGGVLPNATSARIIKHCAR
jgi:hypothetical protein